MLTYLSPQLAIVSVAVFPPVAGVGVWFGRRMKKQQKGVQEALAASSGVAEEVGGWVRLGLRLRLRLYGVAQLDACVRACVVCVSAYIRPRTHLAYCCGRLCYVEKIHGTIRTRTTSD